MTAIRRLDIRGFLEGIEIPVVSCVLQIVPNAPAVLSMQVVPTDILLDLYDRTVVHIFFKDLLEEDSDVPLEDYELFFAGEVRGVEMNKTVGQRSAVLQCEDTSAYWDICQQYIADFSSGGDAFWDRTSSFIGANKSLFDNILRSVDAQLSAFINSKSVTHPETKGLMSGILRMFERMGGVYTGNKRFRGQNDFFSAAELRLRIVDQLGASQRDTTSARLLRHKVFVKWISNAIGSYGSIISYRDILKILFSYIFHEVAPNPLAYYIGPSVRTEYKKQTYTVELNKRDFADYTQRYDRARSSILELAQKLTKAAETNGSFQVTIDGGAKSTIGLQAELIKKQLNKLITEGRAKAGSAEKQLGVIKDAIKYLDTGISALNAHALQQLAGERGDSGRAAGTHAGAAAVFTQAYELLGKVSDLRSTGVKYTKRIRMTIPTRATLYTQLIYPNLYFAPPPRCNVIFPEMYMSFQFKKDYRRQITRMRIQVKCWLSGSGSTRGYARGKLKTSLLGVYYYSPDIQALKKRLYLRSTEGMARVLLPHERFSGIIPSIQSLGRVNFYVARKDKDYRERGGGIPYVQKTANFKFFLDRFGARNASVVGPFNPYLVCGLPALVVDRYSKATGAAPDNFQDEKRDTYPGKRPKQYLGRITQLAHSLVPLGSTTTAVLSTVRTHDEKSELIGAGETDKVRRKYTRGPAPRSVVSKTGGRALAKDTRAYSGKTKDFHSARRVETFQELGLEANDLAELIDNANTQTAGFTYAALSATLLKHSERLDELRKKAEDFSHHTITKALTRANNALLGALRHLAAGRTQQAHAELTHCSTFLQFVSAFPVIEETVPPERVPAEEILRPPWYDPVYDNQRIGPEYYMELLGCGSITDEINLRYEGTDFPTSTQRARTVQHAIDQLVEAYGAIKRGSGGDVISFIRGYTKRPIATLAQVIGEKGFHRHAFGDAVAFEDIIRDPQLGVLNAGDTIRKIDAKMDVRAERRAIVRAYVGELEDKVLLG